MERKKRKRRRPPHSKVVALALEEPFEEVAGLAGVGVKGGEDLRAAGAAVGGAGGSGGWRTSREAG